MLKHDKYNNINISNYNSYSPHYFSYSILLNKKKKKRLEYEAHLERERQKEESRVRREKYNDELGSFFERVEKATLAFRSLVSKSKFVSNYEAYLYYKEYEQLYSELPLKSFDQLANDGEVKKEIKKFK